MSDETRFSVITGDLALTSYLTGQQDGQEWALLDNLVADDVRDAAKAAITMLRQANAIIGLSRLALDDMTPRAQRFAARDVAVSLIEPYLDELAVRFEGSRA